MMKNFFVVTKYELLRYFISPLAYVYLVAFLILNAAMTFYFGHFFERGQAAATVMFWYQPWLYLLFIPGISMRLWAEEFRNKTVIQIMTMPVRIETLVWGKFTASWLFCGLALVLTFPFWLTLNYLGTPDNAVVLTGYIGSFVLAGCMLAISQTMSALTKNQVIALVLAVAANLVFFWSGVEFILSFFRLFTPDYIIDTIASFSFLTHFSTISRGLIELRDILFFTSVILLFNFTTVLIVSFRTSGTSSWLKSTNRSFYIFAWLCLLVAFTGFNLLANNLTRGTKVDFSEDKLFTLDKNTVSILRDLPEPVTAKLYFSNILEQRNPAMRQMFDRVRLLLEQYKNSSNRRFDYRIYHPQNLDNIEDRAIADGIQPIPLIDINQNALFGLTLSDTLKNKEIIPFFTPARMAFLEQDLSAKIYQLSHRKKTAAVLSSLPINGQGGSENMIFQPWEITRRIGEFYNVRYIGKPEDFQERPDVLIMIHPQELSPEMVEAVKEYSRDYGNILLLLDTAAEAPRLYSAVNRPFAPSDLGGLDKFWGFRFYPEYVVADLENSITVDATSNYKNNPAFTQDIIQFKLKGENFNPAHPITKNLQSLLMSSAAVILPDSDEIEFIPLLQASKNSALMPVNVVYDGLNPRQILPYFKADENTKILAAAIHGKNKDNPFTLIAVGDTDFIYNNFWATSQTLLERTYFIPLFNNADFILNSLDYLTNNDALLNLRGKSERDHSFSEIEKMRKNNIFKYKLKEEEIFNRMDEVKQQLQEIWGKRAFEEREIFTADELAIIGSIRKKLNDLRKELSVIRLQTNRDIARIGMTVKFFNIFVIPLVLTLFLLLSVWLKKRSQPKQVAAFAFTRPLIKLTAFAAAVMAAGLISVYVNNLSDIQKFEDKPLIPDLADKINQVEKIVLRTHDQTLTFVNRDGIWIWTENPALPVYQERIRSFLSALMEARFYEKKSAKAENLALFGLQPIDSKGSENTRIELSGQDDTVLSALEVGEYNLDLGRGSNAAYVKFDGQFQVWLAEADFVDLSTDWQQWTYSTLWNLRFGRLESINGQTDTDFLANAAKVLLNTPFISVVENPTSLVEKQALKIVAEDNNQLVLTFYESEDKILAGYTFIPPVENKHLQFFEKYANKHYFEISQQYWDLIKNVFDNQR